MNSKNLIEIKNLEFYWNNQDEFKIQINDFSIQTNEKKLILGKSGIGKSTFLNLICGMISPRAGDIYILSQNLSIKAYLEIPKILNLLLMLCTVQLMNLVELLMDQD